MKEKVEITDDDYNKYLAEAKEQDLFGCILGAVFFGKPQKHTNGYAWPVEVSLRFDFPARDVKGWQKIWQFKMCTEAGGCGNGNHVVKY